MFASFHHFQGQETVVGVRRRNGSLSPKKPKQSGDNSALHQKDKPIGKTFGKIIVSFWHLNQGDHDSVFDLKVTNCKGFYAGKVLITWKFFTNFPHFLFRVNKKRSTKALVISHPIESISKMIGTRWWGAHLNSSHLFSSHHQMTISSHQTTAENCFWMSRCDHKKIFFYLLINFRNTHSSDFTLNV